MHIDVMIGGDAQEFTKASGKSIGIDRFALDEACIPERCFCCDTSSVNERDGVAFLLQAQCYRRADNARAQDNCVNFHGFKGRCLLPPSVFPEQRRYTQPLKAHRSMSARRAGRTLPSAEAATLTECSSSRCSRPSTRDAHSPSRNVASQQHLSRNTLSGR